MKPLFSSAVYQDGNFIFYFISHHKSVIHITASSAKHERAAAFLSLFVPQAPHISPAEKSHACNLISAHIYQPDIPGRHVDFENNFFLRRGTLFQRKIWRLLLEIGYGETMTYSKLALKAGVPGGARAIGNACNANPLALIIPCHRVIGVNNPGGYAGGREVKLKLLEIEAERFNCRK
ncbi:MAG: MGMT family protein [Proteobacteria bacterium]|nr:MGMT family protein [Pseudomonadota bacterium]MBU1737718.1 MGMT family protein [Pseudomonadota bacterium]